jgi:O-acetyl-ADP-ribose deacetylase (regulator of RNase III)
MITFSNGDIFEADTEVIVNTINCIGAMGKGLALEFKNRYPEMNQAYVKACAAGLIKTGEIWPYQVAEEGPRSIIFNFPTKDDWHNPSEMVYIKEGLIHLIYLLGKAEISSIALPALGCKNGQLDWNVVKRVMCGMLKPVEPFVRIVIYEPKK